MLRTSSRSASLRSQRGRPDTLRLVGTAMFGLVGGLLLARWSLHVEGGGRDRQVEMRQAEVQRAAHAPKTPGGEAATPAKGAGKAANGKAANGKAANGKAGSEGATAAASNTGAPSAGTPSTAAGGKTSEGTGMTPRVVTPATGAPSPMGHPAAPAAATQPATGGTANDAVAAKAPAPATVPQRARSSREVVPGRVAYIRCASNTKPCPRDRELEAAVWKTLADLPLCAHLGKEGRADIRLNFSQGKLAELRFKDYDGPGATLPYGSLTACLEGPLQQVRATVSEPTFVISFRFELRPR